MPTYRDVINEIREIKGVVRSIAEKKHITPGLDVYVREDDVRIESQGNRSRIMIGPEVLRGEKLEHHEIPPSLYHVTTARSEIEREPILKSFHQGSQAGLGKGKSYAHQGVSLTRSYTVAVMIGTEIKRHIEIANGVTLHNVLPKWAREDEEFAGIAQGALNDAVDTALEALDLNAQISGYTPSANKDALTQYYMMRSKAGGPENPIILTPIDRFAEIRPEEVAIIEIKREDIPKDTLIRDPDIGLEEIMVHSEVAVRHENIGVGNL